MGLHVLFNLLALCVITILLLPAYAATDTSDYVTLGRRFVLGFLEGGDEAHIYVTTQSTFPVWVNVNISSLSFMERFTVKSNTLIPLRLPNNVNFIGDGKQLTVVSVEADSPVSVYGVTKTGNSLGDGFTAIPVHNLGKNYYIGSYIPDSGNADSKKQLSQLAVIATVDSTTVRVHTTSTITNIQLAKNEAYQIQEGGDLTGSFVTSDQPIAVFTGVACATVPFGKGDCQYLIEQIPDVTTLGRQYIVAPPLDESRVGSSYVIRVIATTPNTTVDILGSSSHSMVLQSKEYYEYEELGSNTTLIIANEPVLVMQYTTSPNSVTGPSMSLIPSIQMYHGNVDFFVPQSDNQNYVSITARCSDGPNLMLTNTQDEIGNDTLVVWDRQYTRDQMCVYQKWVSEPGTYQVSVNQSISARFFVLVNGRSYVSYALPVAYQKEGDACSSNPCLNGATCFNRQSRYDFLCLCQPGWEGRNCHIVIAPHVCHNVVCQNEGRCYAIDEDEQSDDDHVCLCQYGWGGKDCTEDVVNECDDLELPCGDYGTCTDAMGKYTCQCDAGYTGTLCEMNVRPGISQNDTAGVIVVAGVIVGCLCLIAVIINVAFITRERCSMRRRRNRQRNHHIEEFRNNDSMRRRNQQQNEGEEQQGDGNDRRLEDQQRQGETSERRRSRRQNEEGQGETTERRRSRRRSEEAQGETNERRSRRQSEEAQGETNERRRSRRQSDDQPQQRQTSERRRSERANGDQQQQKERNRQQNENQQQNPDRSERRRSQRQNETQQQGGNDNAAFNNDDEKT